MKKTLLLPALLGLSMSAHSVMAEGLNYNVVSINEQVSKEVARDTLNVRLSVREEGRDPAVIAQAVTKKMNQVLAQAKTYPKVEVSVSGRSSYPSSNKKDQTVWTDQATISFKSQDFQALNKLVAAVQSQAQIQSMNYSVSEQKMKSFEDDLMTTALTRFRYKANHIAQGLGGKGYRIVNIDMGSTPASYNSAGYAPKMMRASASMADEAAVMDAEPGNEQVSLHISGQVQVNGL